MPILMYDHLLNPSHAQNVTAEEMEAFRLKRHRADDPLLAAIAAKAAKAAAGEGAAGGGGGYELL